MDKDNLWTRRANSNKLSLSTSGAGSGHGDSFGRNNASFSRRFGGDTSSHGSKTTNPFNASASASSLASPTSASSAFGLGSGAFASFGSSKTPKSPGNPFDLAMKGSFGASTPTATPGPKGASAGPPTPGAVTPKGASLAAQADKEAPKRHPLRHQWVFWYRPPISESNGYQIDYEKTLCPTNPMASVEDFFDSYRHLKRPSELAQMADYHLFKKGVRPIWEDEENRKGGKWVVRLKKGVADRYWEDLCLALVGDQFAEASEEVRGAVVSVRNGEDILSIWTATNGGRNIKIRETMKRILAFPPDTRLDWKSHDSSIQQRTAIEDSRREKASNNNHNERRNKSSQHGNSHNDKQAGSGPSWNGAPEPAQPSVNPLLPSLRRGGESRFFPRSATSSLDGSPIRALTPQSTVDETAPYQALGNFSLTPSHTTPSIPSGLISTNTPTGTPTIDRGGGAQPSFTKGFYPNPLAPQFHPSPRPDRSQSPTKLSSPFPSSASTGSLFGSEDGGPESTAWSRSSNWRQR